ncbi:MAG: EscR/YscR/HrcR family type III secretion system export apparatus protein [Polyangiaceae bacterium]|nr:EscR/YscR/HrcR family type III secretion system export apparatus protein [Polyangiaceae bacterium]
MNDGVPLAWLALSALPLALLMSTSYAKIATVLSILRSALGAEGLPGTGVVVALSAALTLATMAPVAATIGASLDPSREPTTRALVDAAKEPLRAFAARNSAPRELERFTELARRARPDATPADVSVVLPAFVVTELEEALPLGAALLLPFLVLDLLVANVLAALGTQTLSATQVSFPLKLLLLLSVDGLGLLSRALVSSYV